VEWSERKRIQWKDQLVRPTEVRFFHLPCRSPNKNERHGVKKGKQELIQQSQRMFTSV
jgi:hypothetical protein